MEPGKITRLFASTLLRTLSYPLALAIFVSFALIAFSLLFVKPTFQSNDDVGMMLRAQGLATAFEPNPHIFFCNILLGQLLAFFYIYWPDWSWYGYYHVVVIFISTVAIIFSVLKVSFSYYRLFLCSVCFVGLILPLLSNMQFTATSFLAGQAGIFLFISIMLSGDRSEQGQPVKFAWAGCWVVFLCVVSFLVRENSFLLVAILTVPAILVIAIRELRGNPFSIKAFAGIFPYGFLILLFILLVISDFHHYQYYEKTPGWKGFLEFNKLRAQFNDYHAIKYDERTRECFEQVNWSRNDYDMLMNWAFTDPEVYSTDRLAKLISCGGSQSTKKVDWKRVIETIKGHYNFLWPRAWFTIVLLSFLLGLALISRSLFSFGLATLTLLSWFFVLIILITYYKLPIWVFGPSSAFPCWFALLVCQDQVRLARGSRSWVAVKIGRCVVGVALLALAVLAGLECSKMSKQRIASNAELRRCLLVLQPRPDQLFVAWRNFPFENILPFEDKGYLKKMHFVSFGTLNQSPVQRSMLQHFRIRNIMPALYEKDNVFLFIYPSLFSSISNLYSTYIREHYGMQVELTKHFECGSLLLYKAQRESGREEGISQ